MQRLEVSGAVRLIYKSLGVKGLIYKAFRIIVMIGSFIFVKTEIMDQRSGLHVKRLKLSDSEFI